MTLAGAGGGGFLFLLTREPVAVVRNQILSIVEQCLRETTSEVKQNAALYSLEIDHRGMKVGI